MHAMRYELLKPFWQLIQPVLFIFLFISSSAFHLKKLQLTINTTHATRKLYT